MDRRIGQNAQAISLGLGLIAGIAWAVTRDDAVLGAALLLLVIGLMGDRLRKAPGGWEFGEVSHRVSEQVLAALPPPQPVIGTATVTFPRPTIEGAGTVSRAAEETIGPITEDLNAKVIRRGQITASAVIAAANAISRAETPDDLGERVAEYVSLRASLLPIPESFRLLGIKAQLSGDDNPCRVCQPLRGQFFDPNDPEAPRLPIAGCEHELGCRCRYV